MDLIRSTAEHTSSCVLHNIRAVNGLPFQIASDLSVEEHLDKKTISHNKLGDQVNIPVSVVTILLRRFGTRAEHAPKVS